MVKNLAVLKEESDKIISSTQKHCDFYLNKLKYSIFPIPRKSKKPVIDWGIFTKSKIKKEEISKYFNEPRNIGIVTGKISDLIVVDIDGARGWSSLKNNGITYDDIKKHPHVTTGRDGGFHFYFKHPQGELEFVSKNNVLEKVDVKSYGGYVIAPPSKHVDGRIYNWVVAPNPNNLKPMPEKLKKLVLIPRKSTRSEDSSKECEIINEPIFKKFDKVKEKLEELICPFWKQGKRHGLSLSLSGFLRKMGVSKANIKKVIKSICLKANDEEVEARLINVDTTFSKNIEDVIGISGLSEIINIDILNKIRRLFNTKAYFFVNNIGFDEIGIYFLDKDKLPVYITHGKFEFLCKKNFWMTSDLVEMYIIKIGDKEVQLEIQDLVKPKDRLYSELLKARIEISQKHCHKIADLINSFISNSDYPLINTYEMMGWFGNQLIVPRLDRADGILEDISFFDGWNVTAGNEDNYKEIISPSFVSKAPPLFSAIGHAVISPFLPFLKQRNPQFRYIIMHMVGNTDSGKTTMVKAAMGFFGNPHEIMKLWNVTSAGFEFLLPYYFCMPLHLDESTIILNDGKIKIGQWLYSYEHGAGKIRAEVNKKRGNIGLRKNIKWCLNILSTGEDSLLPGAGKGARARAIELYLPVKKYSKTVNEINMKCLGISDGSEIADLSYGFGLKKLLHMLKKDNGEKLNEILDIAINKFKIYSKDIANIESPFVPDKRLMSNWAMVGVGYYLACWILDIKVEDEFIIDMIKKTWPCCFINDESANDAKSLYQKMLSFYYENKNLFAPSKEEYFSEDSTNNFGHGYKGFVEKEDGTTYIYIPKGAMSEVTRGLDLKYTSVMRRQLMDMGLLLSNTSGRGLKRIKTKDSSVEFYCVVSDKMLAKNVAKCEGIDIDEVF